MLPDMVIGILQMRSKILTWGDDLGLSEWTQYNHKVLIRGEKGELASERGDVTMEAKVGTMEDGDRQTKEDRCL